MMHRPCPDVIFPWMQRIPMLLCAVALLAITLIVGCAGDGSQGEQAHTRQSHTVRELEPRPEHGSVVSGTVTFEAAKDGIDAKDVNIGPCTTCVTYRVSGGLSTPPTPTPAPAPEGR